jgi:hypothetical protein
MTRESPLYLALREEAARKGMRLWRNNCGAFEDKTGRWVRYGLANDSKVLSAHIKSGDLIGIRPVLILPEHVGSVIGQFISRECKPPEWRRSPTDAREAAQERWNVLVRGLGGDAKFVTEEGTL